MPTFLDHHPISADMTPEQREWIASRVRAGEPDEHGVKPVNVYFTKNAHAYCLSEAADAESVVASHQALGIEVGSGDVVEVEAAA